MNLQLRWLFLKYDLQQWLDRRAMWIAWHLPRNVVKWAFVRVHAYALNGRGPSSEYALVATSWEMQQPLSFDPSES
jgi:hypothetical protein